jgi:hypothetical protein
MIIFGCQNSRMYRLNCIGWRASRAFLLCLQLSDINLFSYGQGIVDLDPEIPDCAFD